MDPHRWIPTPRHVGAMKANAHGADERVVHEPAFLEGDDPYSLAKNTGPPRPRARLIRETDHGVSFKMSADGRSEHHHHVALRHANHQLACLGETGTPENS
jgi:hypothetical protein